MRRFKHWWRHEWATVPGTELYSIVDQVCKYPGCTAHCLYDLGERIRFGIRP